MHDFLHNLNDPRLAPDGKPRDTRKPYCRPEIQSVHLALEETLATGCKLGADADESCVFPIAIWDVGS